MVYRQEMTLRHGAFRCAARSAIRFLHMEQTMRPAKIFVAATAIAGLAGISFAIGSFALAPKTHRMMIAKPPGSYLTLHDQALEMMRAQETVPVTSNAQAHASTLED
jgi:hypothetical protein